MSVGGVMDDMFQLFSVGEGVGGGRFEVASRINWAASSLIKENCNDLYSFFPFERQPLGEVYIDDEVVIARLKWDSSGRVFCIGGFEACECDAVLKSTINIFECGYKALKQDLGKSWYCRETFTYISRHDSGCVLRSRFEELLRDWLNDIASEVYEENRIRVLRAIPESPQYKIDELRKALWVLEGDESMSQGSGFAIDRNRIVTCEHCVFKDTVLFKHDDPKQRFAIVSVKKNKDIDVAEIDIGVEIKDYFEVGNPDDVNIMDHVLIVGHPNFRIGDSVIAQPGLVVGFRMQHGIRRMLTNAHIVSGCSGGVALDAWGKVIGIAVTGSDFDAEVDKTENHGIIPINAIRWLEG